MSTGGRQRALHHRRGACSAREERGRPGRRRSGLNLVPDSAVGGTLSSVAGSLTRRWEEERNVREALLQTWRWADQLNSNRRTRVQTLKLQRGFAPRWQPDMWEDKNVQIEMRVADPQVVVYRPQRARRRLWVFSTCP